MERIDQQRLLGATGLEVSALGMGTNRWSIKEDTHHLHVFQAALDHGVTFFDTAEVYMGGESERMLGECMGLDRRPVVVATKFAPLPTRVSRHTVIDALDASLSRLNMETIDLYYVHWPRPMMNINTLMDMMALAVRIGKIRAVGVSNFSARQMRQAAGRLARYGIPLAANEVHYNLLHREPETNGVLDACRELNVALVAYKPFERGLLKIQESADEAGQVASEWARPGFLSAFNRREHLRREQVAVLQATLKEIAQGRQKTMSQVALNWLLQRDEHIIPIPGSTSVVHVIENAGALSWRLSEDEFAALDTVSRPWKK